MHIRGCLSVRKSSQGTLSCMPTRYRWFPMIACLYQHNLQGRDNLILEGNHHIRRDGGGHSIVHEYHLEHEDTNYRSTNDNVCNE